jgi:hypothetical protein
MFHVLAPLKDAGFFGDLSSKRGRLERSEGQLPTGTGRNLCSLRTRAARYPEYRHKGSMLDNLFEEQACLRRFGDRPSAITFGRQETFAAGLDPRGAGTRDEG